MSDTRKARNDTDEDTTSEGGQLANPGPVPPAPEDATDSGEGSSSNHVDS